MGFICFLAHHSIIPFNLPRLERPHPIEIQRHQASSLGRFESSDIFRVNQHQGLVGQLSTTVGHIHPFALVAFENLPEMPEGWGAPKGRDHDASSIRCTAHPGPGPGLLHR
jgi:hypothetical protein